MAPSDSLASKTPLASGGQGRTSLDEAVGLSTEKQASGRDPALSDDEYCLPIQVSLVRATELLEMVPEVSMPQKL